LCYPTLEALTSKAPYYGSTVGRVANRIARGKFSVDDKVGLWSIKYTGIRYKHISSAAGIRVGHQQRVKPSPWGPERVR
jgi:hypothetical protein